MNSQLGDSPTYLLRRDIGPAGRRATYLPYPLGPKFTIYLLKVVAETVKLLAETVNQINRQTAAYEQPKERMAKEPRGWSVSSHRAGEGRPKRAAYRSKQQRDGWLPAVASRVSTRRTCTNSK